MRSKFRKKINYTTIKSAKITLVDGTPQAIPMEDLTVLGSKTLEQSQRIINKEYGKEVTALEVEKNQYIYEMEIDTFLEHATKIK